MKTFNELKESATTFYDISDVEALRRDIDESEESKVITFSQWEILSDIVAKRIKAMILEARYNRAYRKCYHVEDGKTIVRAIGTVTGDRFKGEYRYKGMTYGIDVPVNMLPS